MISPNWYSVPRSWSTSSCQTRSIPLPPRSRPSRRVVRVQLHVLVGQVAGVERAAAGAEREPQPEVDLAVVLQVRRRRRRVERQRLAVAVQQQVAHPQRQVRLLERHAGVAGRRHDPAPVRVGAEDRRLHQGALGDRLGDRAGPRRRSGSPRRRCVIRWLAPSASAAICRARSAHTSCDRARRTRRASSPASVRAGAVGEQEDRVVGAGVPLDARCS